MSPTTIGVISIGRMRIPLTSHDPRSFWLKKSASAVPSTTWSATPPKVKMTVFSTASQKMPLVKSSS